MPKNNTKLPIKVYIYFFRELSILLEAGIPILSALKILRKTNRHILKNMITRILENLVAGKNFTESINVFLLHNQFISNLIELGETTGQLNSILSKITLYLEHHYNLQKKISAHLIYPLILLFLSIFIILFMNVIILPKFEILFQQLDRPLPLITQFIFHFSHQFKSYIYFFLFICATIFIILRFLWSQSTCRMYVDKYLFYSSPFKNSYRKFLFMSWCKTLSLSLKSGVPIIESMENLATLHSNSFFQYIVYHLNQNIKRGNLLHTTMRASTYFPEQLIQMVQIGEESGTLEVMLDKTAYLFEHELLHLYKILSQFIQPLIILFLGALIGGVIIAMYLPLFQLGSHF